MRLRKLFNEDGVGKIVKGVNTTQDVQPGETQRQAAKFGNTVDKDGRPPELHSSARKNSSPNTLFNMGLAESDLDEAPTTATQSAAFKVLNNLAARKDNLPFPVKFYDGSIIKVKPSVAKRIINLYYRLDAKKQNDMEDMLNTKNGFAELATEKVRLESMFKDIGGTDKQPEIHEKRDPMHTINKFLDDKKKREERAADLYKQSKEADNEKVKEDIGSLPPLVDLIILAVLAQTTVSAIKMAFKTGKGLLQLKKMADTAGVKLRNRMVGESNPFTDARMNAIKAGKKDFTVHGKKYKVTGDTTDEEEAITNEARDPAGLALTAALDALHRLVSSKGNRMSLSGYAFDISRAFNIGMGPKELEAKYHEVYG